MDNAVRRNLALGQSTWIDYIHREMLTGGEIERLVNAGVTGLTSNPTIFEKAISGSGAYDSALAALAERESDPERVFEALAVADVKDAARALRPVYDETLGRDGYVSLEVSPALAYDAEGTARAARRLWAAVGEPNLMIKVPATPQGIPAVAELIGDGLNVNVTLIFALDAYERVMDAYVEGLRTLAARGAALDRAASVASFFVSRVDTAADAALGEESPLRGTAAVANARAAYALFRERFARADFAALQARGARPQRPLWASTSVKNPAYPDTLYVDSLIGPDTVNTMPPETLEAALDHGVSARTVDAGGDPREALAALADAGVDVGAVTDKLLADGVDAFAASYRKALESVAAKSGRGAAAGARG